MMVRGPPPALFPASVKSVSQGHDLMHILHLEDSAQAHGMSSPADILAKSSRGHFKTLPSQQPPDYGVCDRISRSCMTVVLTSL